MAETDRPAPDGIPHDADHLDSPAPLDSAPGDSRGELMASLKVYVVGLALAILLTATSFWAASTHVLWPPGVPIGLAVLAVAQMGVHLVFFLHITTGPDNTNNVLALAFGVLIVFLVVAGSLWIMANLSANMMPLEMMDLHHQH
ncbi:cytochrome o ubiquinol oxidase subunit IV [Nitrospirillum sp. BR 11828]|uniref:cytochrome o ubiquinol oxidase subunit IV n=1 Tax=Nitrospirillum sp. BR 11828 TaxID=3104325 RepID=UPI002ACAD306|nr:cytochrome o ubiquinol oxidase subunit IV [Nitrospirillum sp. BR 11828]MDZ5648631.1 cytochrome o ubiquinol oxidase subunit IV [Nitrospirillum sp. BR 11828]